MKNSMRITVGILAILFATTGFSFGQESYRVNKNTMLDFNNESKKSEVKIKMGEEFNELRIAINCVVDFGNIDIEIFNPKGEKQGNYSIKSDESVTIGDQTTKKSTAQGTIDKIFIDPMKGDWIIKAIPIAATGKVNINIGQIFRPKAVDPAQKNAGEK